MSDIRVKDLSARAALRFGRTYQVNALAPFPVRPPLQLWQPWRRGFVHGAGDLGAGFGFGGDSNLLKRLKMGIAAEGLDPAGLDSLTDADVTTNRRGVTVRPAALARLSAATREKITAAERPPKMQNWFFERRPALRIARQQAAAQADDYEDSGSGDVEVLRIGVFAAGSNLNSAIIVPPVRLTHIHVSVLLSVSTFNFFQWSVTPPGIADSGAGDAINGAVSVLDNGTSYNLNCDVPVLTSAVALIAQISQPNGAAPSTILVSVAYRRLRRKSIA